MKIFAVLFHVVWSLLWWLAFSFAVCEMMGADEPWSVLIGMAVAAYIVLCGDSALRGEITSDRALRILLRRPPTIWSAPRDAGFK